MHAHQQKFIELAIRCHALRFGEFTLKSGRISPYFFNAGLFNTGAALALLGQCYAAAITAAELDYDMLFGPAYKGIPLASATAIALAEKQQRDVGYCFNRKEAKEHGEGGVLVGAPLQGRVVIVDDVITAGTAVREVMQIIHGAGATPAAVIVGLDRQEKGQGKLSAIEEIEQAFGIPVISVITLGNIIDYLRQQTDMSVHLIQIEAYRTVYGIN